MLDSKKYGDLVIKKVNTILDSSPSYDKLEEDQEKEIREIIFDCFKAGYEDCLKDVREGLIDEFSTKDLLIEFERLLTRRMYRESHELDKMVYHVRNELLKRITV